MFKSLIIAATLVATVSANAYTTLAEAVFASQQLQIQESVVSQGLNWVVGQENNYKMDIGGFLKGTMKMSVREISAEGGWLVQDIDLSIQKQKVEVLIDMSNGQIKKMIVNGKEQAPPKTDFEIVETKEDHITVAAGSFDVIYIKVKDNANNGQISEQWVNPRDIPISGMAKSLGNSQFGKVTVELTSFKK
jgi:hypothetical protein